ncbi:helix-turn-helix domain-containing protein [Nocardia sp. NPDC004123]
MRGCGHNHFELAQRTDMTGPAVYRLVSELVEHGWLQRTSA